MTKNINATKTEDKEFDKAIRSLNAADKSADKYAGWLFRKSLNAIFSRKDTTRLEQVNANVPEVYGKRITKACQAFAEGGHDTSDGMWMLNADNKSALTKKGKSFEISYSTKESWQGCQQFFDRLCTKLPENMLTLTFFEGFITKPKKDYTVNKGDCYKFLAKIQKAMENGKVSPDELLMVRDILTKCESILA